MQTRATHTGLVETFTGLRTRGSRAAMCLGVFCLTACGNDSPVEPGGSRRPLSVQVTIADTLIAPGQSTKATAVALDARGAPIDGAPATFASTVPEVAVVNPTTGDIFGVAPGNTEIAATIGGVTGRRAITIFQLRIRINEIAPGTGSSGWVELVNLAGGTADLSGWTLTTRNAANGFVLPPGSVIGGSAYLVFDAANFPDGIGAESDAMHLFSGFGVQVDSFSWTSPPVASFARCPDAFGSFGSDAPSSRGAGNRCP
jgi:hypothetical protein